MIQTEREKSCRLPSSFCTRARTNMSPPQSYPSAHSLTRALLAGLSFPALGRAYDAVICGENGYSGTGNDSLSCGSPLLYLTSK